MAGEVADVTKKVGAEHFVHSSVGGAERNTGITHWETKWVIEKHIRSLNLPITILRPPSFMETYHVTEVEIAGSELTNIEATNCRCRS